MKRIPTEAELELKEAKEAIQTLKEYCESRVCCDICDEDIKKWCIAYKTKPYGWTVKEK